VDIYSKSFTRIEPQFVLELINGRNYTHVVVEVFLGKDHAYDSHK